MEWELKHSLKAQSRSRKRMEKAKKQKAKHRDGRRDRGSQGYKKDAMAKFAADKAKKKKAKYVIVNLFISISSSLSFIAEPKQEPKPKLKLKPMQHACEWRSASCVFWVFFGATEMCLCLSVFPISPWISCSFLFASRSGVGSDAGSDLPLEASSGDEREMDVELDSEGPPLRFDDLVVAGTRETTPLYVRRDTLAKWISEACFDRLVTGLFVKISVGEVG